MASPKTGRKRGSAELEELAARGPGGLAVDVLCAGDEQFAIFTWGDDAPEEAVALTKAEREVLSLIALGASNAEIAAKRGSSVRTVANQVASLLRKLRATSRFDLVRKLGGHGAKRSET